MSGQKMQHRKSGVDLSKFMPRLYYWLAYLISKHNGKVLIFFACLTLLIGYHVKNLKIKPDFINILSKTSNVTKAYIKTVETLGSSGWLFVVAHHQDSKQLIKFANILSNQLIKIEEVRFVVKYKNDPWIRDHILQLMSKQQLEEVYSYLESEYKKQNPFYLGLNEPAGTSKTSPSHKIIRADQLKRLEGMVSQKKEDVYFLSPQGDTIFILIKPKGTETNPDFVKIFINKVNNMVDHINTEQFSGTLGIEYSGHYQIQFEEMKAIQNGIQWTGGIALLLIVIVLYFVFGSFAYLAAAVIPLQLSMLAILGFVAVTVGHLNSVTAMIISILSGLGIEAAIYNLLAWKNFKFESNRSEVKRLYFSFKSTLSPIISSMLTNACAFFLMMFSDLEGFKELGFLSGFGIIIATIYVCILSPALIVFFQRKFVWAQDREPKKKHNLVSTQYFNKGIAWFTRKFSIQLSAFWGRMLVKAYLLLFILLSVGIAKVALNINFENNTKNLMSKNLRSITLFDQLNQITGHGLATTIILFDDLTSLALAEANLRDFMQKDPMAARHMDYFASYNTVRSKKEENNSSVITKIHNLINKKAFDHIDQKHQDIIQLMREKTEPEKVLTEPQSAVLAIPDNIISQFEIEVPGTSRRLYPLYLYSHFDLALIADMTLWKEILDNFNQQYYQKKLLISDTCFILPEIVSSVSVFIWPFLAVISSFIFIVLLLEFHNFVWSLFIFMPIVFGLMATLASLVLFKIPLNFMNLIFIPMIIGLSNDYCIHLAHYLKTYLSQKDALVDLKKFTNEKSVRGIVSAMIMNLIGFGALYFSNHAGLESIGFLTAAGIFYTAVFAFMIIPGVSIYLHRRGWI